MSLARVRVELKPLSNNPTDTEREIAWRRLSAAFNKAYQKSGIANAARQKESYESPGRKRRRKAKESDMARLKAKLKENFSQQGN